jgi:hypothetical protein
LYGFTQNQIDSFNPHQRHGVSQTLHHQNHQQLASTNGTIVGPTALNPLLESSTTTNCINNNVNPYSDLHHRGFQNNNNIQQQQQNHHAMMQTHGGSYCIKNPNASSYFPGSWMQAYAGM